VLVNKAFKFRIYPTPEQEKPLSQQFGASRFVYNYFLRQRIDYYAAHKGQKKQGLNYHDTAKMLTELKRQPEYVWLKEANSQALQAALRNLDTAYHNFFENRAEFPKFKSKRSKQSFHVPQSFYLDAETGRLSIPKLAPLKIIVHRPLEGEAKSVTVSRTPAGRYFASILCEVEVKSKPKKRGRVIGLDLGLKSFAVMSDGEKIDPPQHFRKAETKLTQLQRRLSRKQKGSQGRDKARVKVARQHEKIANQRADFLHKLSRRLVDESQAIYVESLNVNGMMSNHHLAKSISDSGWSEFVRQLEYKSAWYGNHFGQIDRFFPSSKRHAACGYIYQDLTLSEREWTCPECGTLVDRDENAAQNILTFARASAAGTGGQLSDSQRRAGTALTHTPVETRVRQTGQRNRKPSASVGR
jgi:putative transposase